MPKQIEELYKELVSTDRELSYEQRNYDDLQEQLEDLESREKNGNLTIENFHEDINHLNSRLNNIKTVIDKQCEELETVYGEIPPGNSLPNTLDEILKMSDDEKTNAKNVLDRILSEHQADNDHQLDEYEKLVNELNRYEQEFLDVNLTFGQLPDTEEKIFSLDEANPKDKQTINAIMNLLNSKGKNDIASTSKKTWEEAKKEYEKIKEDYEALRKLHEEQVEQFKNLSSADLNTLRQQQNGSISSNESSHTITTENIALINEYLKNNKDSLDGIESLEEYFRRENELYASKPDTSALDDIPEVQHFFTEFNQLTGEAAQKARNVANALIENYNKENPTPCTAKSIEDYEASLKEQTIWEETKTKILAKIQNQSLEKIRDIANDDLDDQVYKYDSALLSKQSAIIQIIQKYPTDLPTTVTEIKKIQQKDPVEFVVLSRKIEDLSKDDSKKVIVNLADEPYTAISLIKDHTEMRELEARHKKAELDKDEFDRLKYLQDRVREIKLRLENEKELNKEKQKKLKKDKTAIEERNNLKKTIKEATENIAAIEKNISALVKEETKRYENEAAAKKKYIKDTVIGPKQRDVKNELEAYNQKVKNHNKLSKNIDSLLAKLKKEQESILSKNERALRKDEKQATEKNKDTYSNAESTKSMIEIIKEENKARKNNSSYQKVLNDKNTLYKTQIQHLSEKVTSLKKETENWIKEDKEARVKKIQSINNDLTSNLNDNVKSARKEARAAGTEAKITGYIAQKVGTVTNFYRRKIREVTDGMIKAPRLEKEAELKQLTEKLEKAGITSAFMEIDHVNSISEEKFQSSKEEALSNENLNLADDQIHDISKQIIQLNTEILELKKTEEKRLQENEIKFNKIYGKTIPTEREQLEQASIAKRDSEIKAANGDQKKIDRANAEYDLRKSELDAQFSEEDLQDEKLNKELTEINAKSEEWGKHLNEANLSKIDTFVSVGESMINFALGKLQGGDSSEGLESINVKESLEQMKESLTSEPETEHIVNTILEIGEAVYQKLQTVNDSLNEKYQESSREHAFKTNYHETMDHDNKRFQEICKNDVENKMGVSLKDKRITYLNEQQKPVIDKLNQDLDDKLKAQEVMRTQVRELTAQVEKKKTDLSNSTQKMQDGFSRIENLEKQMDELRDVQLDNYRKNLKQPLTKAVDAVKINIGEPISNADVLGTITNSPLDANASLDDVMACIHKINVNGIGLINYIDPNNEYSKMLSANEADQRAFTEKMLNSAGSVLNGQFGKSIISVEKEDHLLHPVLLEGDAKYKEHNNSTIRMVADFNDVRLESAKLNVMARESKKTAEHMNDQPTLSENEKKLQNSLDTAVKKSRSRVSLTELMEEEKPSKTNRFFSRNSDRSKEQKQIKKENAL